VFYILLLLLLLRKARPTPVDTVCLFGPNERLFVRLSDFLNVNTLCRPTWTFREQLFFLFPFPTIRIRYWISHELTRFAFIVLNTTRTLKIYTFSIWISLIKRRIDRVLWNEILEERKKRVRLMFPRARAAKPLDNRPESWSLDDCSQMKFSLVRRIPMEFLNRNSPFVYCVYYYYYNTTVHVENLWYSLILTKPFARN
jgi:hypothetical protein